MEEHFGDQSVKISELQKSPNDETLHLTIEDDEFGSS